MRIRWYGQSAFLIEGGRTVFVDPFGDVQDSPSAGCGSTTRRSRVWKRTCCS